MAAKGAKGRKAEGPDEARLRELRAIQADCKRFLLAVVIGEADADDFLDEELAHIVRIAAADAEDKPWVGSKVQVNVLDALGKVLDLMERKEKPGC